MDFYAEEQRLVTELEALESAHSGGPVSVDTVPFDFSAPQAQEVLAHFSAIVGSLRIRLESENAALDSANAQLVGKNAALLSENAALEATNAILVGENAAIESANAALERANAVLQSYNGELERRISIYERTLGLAVLPVLLRRGALMLIRRIRSSAQ